MAKRGPTAIENNRLGELGEMWVSFLATWKGAEVYPNLMCVGEADLLMRINGSIYMFDVKVDQWHYQKNRWVNTHSGTVKDPVIPIAVCPTGDICNWSVRWIRGRHPSGLENFWSKDFKLTSTQPNETTQAAS